VRCFLCNGVGHKRQNCPTRLKPTAGVCQLCGCFHPSHIACGARASGNGVYATAVNEAANDCVSDWGVDAQDGFVVPIVVNGCNVHDTGCQLGMLIHPQFVRPNDYLGEFVKCKGAFDLHKSHRVPVAKINVVAPSLGCTEPIQVKVGVWALDGVPCLLGNPFVSDTVCKRSALKQNGASGGGQCDALHQSKITGCPANPGQFGDKSPTTGTDLGGSAHVRDETETGLMHDG